jgi:serine/threonine protein kinase
LEQIANYPVLRKLGEGATSEVFLCQDPFRGREVAVKRIFPETLRDPARGRLFRKLFFTEASLAGKLEHPHIAQIYDAGIGEESGYIVMEYVPGGTMERFCAPENLLPIEQTVEIAFKCARAIAYAHAQGVTHRDIKPGNILYAATPADVRIGDFGLAQKFSAETTQITGIGSPAYMSPEQVREELVDHRTDIYSLGVVLYQLLTGCRSAAPTSTASSTRSRSRTRRHPRASGPRCRRRSTASCARPCTRTPRAATRAATKWRRS